MLRALFTLRGVEKHKETMRRGGVRVGANSNGVLAQELPNFRVTLLRVGHHIPRSLTVSPVHRSRDTTVPGDAYESAYWAVISCVICAGHAIIPVKDYTVGSSKYVKNICWAIERMWKETFVGLLRYQLRIFMEKLSNAAKILNRIMVSTSRFELDTFRIRIRIFTAFFSVIDRHVIITYRSEMDPVVNISNIHFNIKDFGFDMGRLCVLGMVVATEYDYHPPVALIGSLLL
jgi:hypothetical protein